MFSNQSAAANPAIASRLQSTHPGGRVAELESLGGYNHMTALKKIAHLLIRAAHLVWLVSFLYGFLPGPLSRLLSGDRPQGEWRLNVLMIALPLLWFVAAIALFFRRRWAWIISFLSLIALELFLLIVMPYQQVGWQILLPTVLLILLLLTRREYFCTSYETAV
jgi:hypothetical protein